MLQKIVGTLDRLSIHTLSRGVHTPDQVDLDSQHVVALLRACVEKRGGTMGVLDRRAGGRRGKRKERDPVMNEQRSTGTRPCRHRRREWTQRQRDTNKCILTNDK